jgi:hypothetical protein
MAHVRMVHDHRTRRPKTVVSIRMAVRRICQPLLTNASSLPAGVRARRSRRGRQCWSEVVDSQSRRQAIGERERRQISASPRGVQSDGGSDDITLACPTGRLQLLNRVEKPDRWVGHDPGNKNEGLANEARSQDQKDRGDQNKDQGENRDPKRRCGPFHTSSLMTFARWRAVVSGG